MSYGFNMFFIECKPENVLNTCLNIVKKIVDNPDKLIQNSLIYVPSIRYNIENRYAYTYNSLWLYSLFNFNFVYWEQHELLGLVGESFGDIESNFNKSVYFQNSCDQDYEYADWPTIKCFSDIIFQVVNMSIKQLAENFDDYTMEEINHDINYYKRCLVYSKIYDTLDLDKWLYGHDGDFRRITINGIESSEIKYQLMDKLNEIISKEGLI